MNAFSRKIGVLIIDDSALVRRLLTELLESDHEIEVLGTAGDAYVAREKIKALNPDVLTLDVEMPKMDGLTFLRNLMRLRPLPVVMVSTLTEHGADITLDALAAGAVDYLPKPKIDIAGTLRDYRDDLIAKIKAAAGARVFPMMSPRDTDARVEAHAILPKSSTRRFKTTDRVIAIGGSTGGIEAIKQVLMGFTADTPGVMIAQHISKGFSAPFAKRLHSVCRMAVCEAADGQQVLPGHVYVAPGDAHLLLVRDGARYVCRLDHGPPVNRHRPSVDVLFRSVALQAGSNAVGVILTGMGKDGAQGLKDMREAGAPTIAQDEASSVVWGMPGVAVSLGAASQVLSLSAIGSAVYRLATASSQAA